MQFKNYSPSKATFTVPHKSKEALKESLKLSLQRSISQSQDQSQSLENNKLNRFLTNQSAQKIISPFKKQNSQQIKCNHPLINIIQQIRSQREALNFHNLNILQLRNVNGLNSLLLSKNDASPAKRKYLDTQASTIRSELVIQAMQRNQDDYIKDFKRTTPLFMSKSQVHLRSSSLSNLNLSKVQYKYPKDPNQGRTQFKIYQIQGTKQDSYSPSKVNSMFDSSKGLQTFSTNFYKTPKLSQSVVMRRSESQGFRSSSQDLNSQVQIKINEYDNLNQKISQNHDEKQMLQQYIEQIKKEIHCERLAAQMHHNNQTKFNRESNNNAVSINKFSEESIQRSLEIKKQFDELKQIESEYKQAKTCNNQILEQIEAEKLLIQQLKADIYYKKIDQLDQQKQKEVLMKDLQLQHKMMISVEKKFIDKANMSNQIVHNVNANCLPKEFVARYNIQGDTVYSKNNIVSLQSFYDLNENQESLQLKNSSSIYSPVKTSPSKHKKNDDNFILIADDKNEISQSDNENN